MSKKKKYTNPYTVLEKVKKGELKATGSYNYSTTGTHYGKHGGGGLFDRINFYKKPDLITPHLHYIDEDRLRNIVDGYIKDDQRIQNSYKKFASTTDYKKLAAQPQVTKPDGTVVSQAPDFKSFNEKIKDTYDKIPKHLKYDIFKLYYNKMKNIEFEKRDDKNYTKFKFLERSNNPVGRIMSETSNLKSSIFTRNMMMYFVMQMVQMSYIDPDGAESLMNGLNGDGNDGVDGALKKMMDSGAGQKALKDALDEATQTCNQIDQNIPQEDQEGMFESAGGGQEAGKLGPEYLKEISQSIQKVKISMGALKEKIQKLMDKSTAFFSARKEYIYEDFLHSDNLGNLDDYFYLHPRLRKFLIEDVQIRDQKLIGKIDIYIDISGSMSSSCGAKNANGDSITKLDFAKGFAAKLLDLDMLNKLYLFNDRVRERKTNIISIATITDQGGTNLNEVVRNINATRQNALVITDAEDHCSIYSDYAYFIGVAGARFTGFSADVIPKYSENGQAVVFDGQKIFNVDKRGQTIMN